MDIIYYSTVLIAVGMLIGGAAVMRYLRLGDYMGTITAVSTQSVFVRHEQPLMLDARLKG